MALTKVLIAVKTYPTLSTKYDELVCTAEFREDGTWIRIYPVSFRKKSYDQQYKKYDWIELDLVKNTSDFRPESYRPYSHDAEIKILDHIDTEANWTERKKFVLGKIYYNLTELIAEAKDKNVRTSLAVFKPTIVKDFKIEEVDREWDKDKLAKLRQMNIFQTADESKFEVVRKLPYKFSYVIEDNQGRESTMMIEDWEIGQLFWRCLAKYEGDESRACEDVRKKYMEDFAGTKDLHLFLGTTQIHHHVSHNPFMIIGTFYPKFEEPEVPDSQLSLF
ncbi:hypothetical protein [Desertivirga xinjiangensis]|uniref:hypothetical protein n=1 Tax=Desertivirga xinjiangensis TaxID=539206 RepID=UPI0021095BA8|nr:hypothetical protein [Pedobacter xinjiangensis]